MLELELELDELEPDEANTGLGVRGLSGCG